MTMKEREQSLSVQDPRWWPGALLAVAGVGWWWSIVSARSMTTGMSGRMAMGRAAMSFGAFVVAWVAMMAAMMLPAILPVVRLYARAAARGAVAPVLVFLSGYAVVWSVIGIPAYAAWRALRGPLAHGSPTAGRIAGVVVAGAAAYQLSPLKSVCLRHCRSPLSFFMAHAKNLDRPSGALVAGARHGLFCLGCCWMLMAVLVAFGTMQLWWMAGVAALILLEKVAPHGDRAAVVAGVGFAALAGVLLVHPQAISNLI